MGRGFLGICVDTVRDFQTVHIGVVLQLPAESIADRRGNSGEDGKNKYEHDQCQPVAEFAHAPALLEAGKCPVGDSIKQVKADKKSYGGPCNADEYVIEDVMSHLMAEDK